MNTISLACVGDLMCGDSFYSIGSGVASSIDRHGAAFLPDDVKDLLGAHQLTFGNLECVLSDVDRRDRSLRSLHMRGRPTTAALLREWGVGVVSVANNHILEQGMDAARDTVVHLESAGIGTAGAGGDGRFGDGVSPAIVAVDGEELAFFGYCTLDDPYVYPGSPSLEALVHGVSESARAGRVVIVSVHWGHELMDRPDADQRHLADILFEAGATIILGHHPHVFQGVEQRDGRLVVYSLGNFVFNGFDPDTKWSALLSITIRNRRVEAWTTHPFESDAEHRPRLATGPRADELNAEISRRNRLAQAFDDETAANYHDEFVARREANRRRLRRHLRTNATRVSPVFLPQLLARPVQRRLQLW